MPHSPSASHNSPISASRQDGKLYGILGHEMDGMGSKQREAHRSISVTGDSVGFVVGFEVGFCVGEADVGEADLVGEVLGPFEGTWLGTLEGT